MKTKTIILLGAAALITLSFTFANATREGGKSSGTTSKQQSAQNEPVGGLTAEEIVR